MDFGLTDRVERRLSRLVRAVLSGTTSGYSKGSTCAPSPHPYVRFSIIRLGTCSSPERHLRAAATLQNNETGFHQFLVGSCTIELAATLTPLPPGLQVKFPLKLAYFTFDSFESIGQWNRTPVLWKREPRWMHAIPRGEQGRAPSLPQVILSWGSARLWAHPVSLY